MSRVRVQSIRRAFPAAAFAAGVAALAAGCGGSSPKTTTSTGGQSSGNFVTQAYKYAACMHDHGVSNYPEPRVSTSGGSTQIAQVAGGGVTASPQYKAASTACRSILPGPASVNPGAQAQQQRARAQDELSFARCMRGRGINGFPDPSAQGKLTLPMVQAAGIDLTAPQFRTAALACIPAANGILTRAAVLQATSGNPAQSGSQTSGGSTPQTSAGSSP